jgi:membrane-associated phospholipid phosphatase
MPVEICGFLIYYNYRKVYNKILLFKRMSLIIKSNFRNLIEIFFKQITELGSLTIIGTLILFMYFFNTILAIKIFIGVAIVTTISIIVKMLFFCERPKKQPVDTWVHRLDASSFPSIHSARITVLIFWLVIYSSSIVLTFLLFSIGIIVAYSRMYLKKHYFRDVVGGIMLAMVVNLLIWYLM